MQTRAPAAEGNHRRTNQALLKPLLQPSKGAVYHDLLLADGVEAEVVAPSAAEEDVRIALELALAEDGEAELGR